MTYVHPSLQISKLDAAKRQLETVIRLYFHDGDPVSIHTLAAAAYNVIRDVNKKRGGKKMVVKEETLDFVRPEKHAEYCAMLNEAENFFKHADRDHEATLDFNPRESEVLIWDACTKYWELTGEHPGLFQVYRGWFIDNHTHLFRLTTEMEQLLARTRGATSGGRAAYFAQMLPLVMRSGLAE